MIVSSTHVTYPLIPNSEPSIKRSMLETVGVDSIDDLFAGIPEHLRFREPLDLPPALRSEHELKRHVSDLLDRNSDCSANLSFLGGGCWQHAVPSLCLEIGGRAEFLTAYWGTAYTDLGKYQAFFEYASLLGDLLELDAVSLPTYDWGMAAGVSLRMACRIAGRQKAVLVGAIGPDRRATIRAYCGPTLELVEAPYDRRTGQIEIEAVDLDGAGAVYFESPCYLGAIETQGAALTELAHEQEAVVVAGVDPTSLGVLAPPAEYGADIVCGDLQPLGVPMAFGSGLAGFIASADTERFIREYPTFLIGLTPTEAPGEHGYGLVAHHRTSFVQREKGKDFGGTTTGLWAIMAGVYLALLGPQGMRELGEGILQRSHYAAERLGRIPGVRSPHLRGPYFKEFVLNLDESGVDVSELLARLLERGIFGGIDLSKTHPELGQSILVAVTEVHTKADIDRLADAVAEIIE